MKFALATSFSVLALPLLAAAIALPDGGPGCSTGTIDCCDSSEEVTMVHRMKQSEPTKKFNRLAT